MASLSKRTDTRKTTFKVSYFLLDDCGRKKKTSRSFKNESEASKYKTKMDELEKSSLEDPIAFENKTISWLIRDYIKIHCEDNWAPNTFSKNMGKIDNYIIPLIGNVKLVSINIRFINKFYKSLKTVLSVKTGQPLTKEMIVSIHKILTATFNYAVNNDILKKNPCIGAEIPKLKKPDKNIWKTDVLKEVLNDYSNPQLHLILNIMFFGTLRPSELSGLKMEDIEFDVNDKGMALIHVNREFIRITKAGYEMSDNTDGIIKIFPSQKDAKSFMVESTLKTEGSKRHFWIPQAIAILLKKEIDYINSIKSGFSKGYKDAGFIFVYYGSGRPKDKDAIREMLTKYVKHKGIDYVTPHAMRHMSITERIGITDLKSIQTDAGHSSFDQIMKRYGHAKDENRIEAINNLSEVFLKNNNEDKIKELDNHHKDIILNTVLGDQELIKKVLELAKRDVKLPD